MSLEVTDTIVALSSAAGAGIRSVVRLSGPDAFSIARTFFLSAEPMDESVRRAYSGVIHLCDLPAWPADLYLFPSPRTYTGQPIAELHVLSSPPLVERLIAELMTSGARAAKPGEFTMRAFLAGKRDLPRAEAVNAVISASNRADLSEALSQLAGGVSQPLHGLRDDLLNLLADVEAGLDFVDEDISFAGRDDLLLRLTRGLAQLTTLRRQLEQRAVGDRVFRAVLAGAPNVGKSSLFNAISGGNSIVSDRPGTTRDYLVRRIDIDGTPIELVDTAGWQAVESLIDRQAQSLGSREQQSADLLLWCVEAGNANDNSPPVVVARSLTVVVVATKCDLASAAEGQVPTSARMGVGLEELRRLIQTRARSFAQPALAPSVSRCRHHVDACVERLRKAHRTVLFDDPPEILAAELRGALDELGAMIGAIFTDDLLDRIFSRFCIGK
jgi:tRNA modification GTPase